MDYVRCYMPIGIHVCSINLLVMVNIRWNPFSPIQFLLTEKFMDSTRSYAFLKTSGNIKFRIFLFIHQCFYIVSQAHRVGANTFFVIRFIFLCDLVFDMETKHFPPIHQSIHLEYLKFRCSNRFRQIWGLQINFSIIRN